MAWMLKLWTQIVACTQVVYKVICKQVSPIPIILLPLEGWTSSLQQLPPFNYGYHYAHLVQTQFVDEKLRSTAAATFGAGTIKHNEEGYRLFHDDHVGMVEFPPGFATDRQCFFRGVVKPPFKTTGSYSTVVALSKILSYVLGAQCNSNARGGGCGKHCAALLYNILDYVELGLAIIPENKTCTENPQQWNSP